MGANATYNTGQLFQCWSKLNLQREIETFQIRQTFGVHYFLPHAVKGVKQNIQKDFVKCYRY